MIGKVLLTRKEQAVTYKRSQAPGISQYQPLQSATSRAGSGSALSTGFCFSRPIHWLTDCRHATGGSSSNHATMHGPKALSSHSRGKREDYDGSLRRRAMSSRSSAVAGTRSAFAIFSSNRRSFSGSLLSACRNQSRRGCCGTDSALTCAPHPTCSRRRASSMRFDSIR